MSDFQPRPKQRDILAYRSGWMGIAAVPGAGKTRTLSELAARLLHEAPLDIGQELLIVTLTQSAVGGFSYQLQNIMKHDVMLGGFRYRVRSLHGLANDIVSERPDLVGLGDDFNIIDDRAAYQILEASVTAWRNANPQVMNRYIQPAYHENYKVQREQIPRLLMDMASAFIKRAKDNQFTPQDIDTVLKEGHPDDLPLAVMCADIYSRYQQGLSYRGGVDFQDLIRLALRALQQDPDYKARLRQRWPYILEDEAQDSSLLQETILRELTSDGGNWVRVGDPNQAIYETFTTANPQFLRDFLTEQNVMARDLPNSGRSQPSIIALANHLIDWSVDGHPVQGVREKQPLTRPHIEPTPKGDPQPNPPDEPFRIILDSTAYASHDELAILIQRLRQTLREDPNQTVVVLSPSNHRGYSAIDAIQNAKLPYVELLQSSTNTREVAGTLYRVMNLLANPTSAGALANAYQAYRRSAKHSANQMNYVRGVMSLLKTCHQVETFIAPSVGVPEWLDEAVPDDDALRDELIGFREWLVRMIGVAALPVDQLVLTIAQSLFDEPIDLAAAYSLALQLRRDEAANEQNRILGQQAQPWGLTEFTHRLMEIAKNERKFLGANDDQGFNPEEHRGKVVVTTVHKAKGLEWDSVFLLSVSNYDFPAALDSDNFIGEKWYVMGRLNLPEEALAQLEALAHHTPYREGDATNDARVEYAAERLRLLYVAMTRARRQLVITWNTGNNKKYPNNEAVALRALRQFWERKA